LLASLLEADELSLIESMEHAVHAGLLTEARTSESPSTG
jgi:hypothetical protein